MNRSGTTVRLCPPCQRRLGRDLQRMPALYLACEEAMAARTTTGERVSGGATPGIPLNVSAVEVRHAVRRALVAWCELVAAQRTIGRPPRSVHDMARFLHRHLDWLAAHPFAGDLASQLAGLTEAAHAIAYPDPPRTYQLGGCIEPTCTGTLIAVVRPYSSTTRSEVVCDANGEHRWLGPQLSELGRQTTNRKLMMTHWLTPSEVALLFGVKVGNVYRLASENGWRRRTAGGRVYYHADDVHRTMAPRSDASR